MNKPIIVWFRQDLRLQDHAALVAAAASEAPVIPVYVYDHEPDHEWSIGSASRWWLHYSLASLQQSLQAQHDIQLILRSGDTVDVILALVNEVDAQGVYWSRGYEPQQIDVEQSLSRHLKGRSIQAKRFAGQILFEPDLIKNKSGEPFKVFTPFWKNCLAVTEPHPPRPAPSTINKYEQGLPSASLDDWALLPTKPNWAGGIADAWQPGEAAAHERLQTFVNEAVANYKDGRDRPDLALTSKLSPYLHFGEISPRQVWHTVQPYLDRAETEAGARTFMSEIGWREFSYHLLFHFPDFPEQPFRKNFLSFPWSTDKAALKRWQQGLTGYPMVDAGMRELWHTGWMHNRVRMIVASFLVKHLLIPWQEGEAWFWDCLVDADLASNSASWQWVAGCGADAAPYFRIFNPITQGKKFDPEGVYVRRWVPELEKLPMKFVHAPWEASEADLKSAGITLGKQYPQPMVNHAEARQRALAAFDAVKKVA